MANNYAVLVQPANSELGAEGIVVGDITEGGHTITNEIVDKIRGGKTDRDYGAHAEEVTFTANRVEGDVGQEALDDAIRNKEQIKIWLIDKRVKEVTIDAAQVDGHDAVFGYSVVSEISKSFDDEEDTIEHTLAIKVETAKGALPKLPDVVLNPSTAAIDFEAPGEYTGSLENRDNTPVGQ